MIKPILTFIHFPRVTQRLFQTTNHLSKVKHTLPLLITRLTEPSKLPKEITELNTFYNLWEQDKKSLIKDKDCMELLVDLLMKLLDSLKFVSEEDFAKSIGLLFSLSEELNFKLSEDQMIALVDAIPKPISSIA